jgi:hypothetical protein
MFLVLEGLDKFIGNFFVRNGFSTYFVIRFSAKKNILMYLFFLFRLLKLISDLIKNEQISEHLIDCLTLKKTSKHLMLCKIKLLEF